MKLMPCEMEYDPEHLFLVLQNKASNQTSFPSEILHDDAARWIIVTAMHMSWAEAENRDCVAQL